MNNNKSNTGNDCSEILEPFQNSGEIFELIVAFEHCTLPRASWTSSTRLVVVFWYLYMNPSSEARSLIKSGIRRYNFEHNITAKADIKDNEAITSLLIKAVSNYLKQNKGAVSFVALVNGLFRHFEVENRKENNRKQEFHAAISTRARINMNSAAIENY